MKRYKVVPPSKEPGNILYFGPAGAEEDVKRLLIPFILFLTWILHMLTKMIEKLWPIEK